MDLAAVMDELAVQLRTIPTLTGRTFAYPPDSINPPTAIVSYPDSITFDETYGRGMDIMTLPVALVVGRAYDRVTREQIAGYVNGSGASSVKAVLEAGTYTSCDTVTVADVAFDVVTIAGTDYFAATFAVDIAGSGA